LDTARQLAEKGQNNRLHVEAFDALAQLYEEQGRPQDALSLSQQGIAIAHGFDKTLVADFLINLEWRLGRLFKTQGKKVQALAAYLRAVELIESVRQDIPIEYEDGQSSFRTTLEPIYQGYVDLLLQQADNQQPEVHAGQLRSAIDTIELIKQSELQDFLGDRCAVEAVQGGSSGRMPLGTAALYPLLLPDRIELLLETTTGIQHRTINVAASTIRQDAGQFAAMLRNGVDDYLRPSQQLYRWLLAPFETTFTEQKIESLIVIPDGVLRLVPIGALHDGKRFAIENFAISIATGLSMTNSAPSARKTFSSLIAGVSEPGDVVGKLSSAMTSQILGPDTSTDSASTRGLAKTHNLRSFRPQQSRNIPQPNASSTAHTMREIEDLKARLALPGVKAEINSLAKILTGTDLLNEDFTIDRFRNETGSGEYQIVHIASHGVFGGSTDTSFIMAHDDILTMDGLQSLLRAERFQKNPIELLSLSACQTAEGNDRSPLGISGAAIKARAKSVLGTLWPVEDNAARSIMELLYAGLTTGKLTKTEALRQAQVDLIRAPDTSHPFFWAPFVLIGNWQ
jgi:CHAT domain-containing protein